MLVFPPPLAGEGQGGGSLRNHGGNCFKYAGAIGPYVVIAEAKYPKRFRLDHGRAPGVCLFSLIRKMLSAVQLDHQPGRMTDEIGDVVFDRNLAPETDAAEPVIPQLRPENALGIGRVLPECACV